VNIKQATQDLLEIKAVLDNLRIKFWLTHGTLLGAIREKSFIGTDGDMDIRILAEDWSPKICEAFIAMNFRCASIRHYPPLITKLSLRKRVKTDLALEYYYPPDDVYICLTKNPDDHMTIIASNLYKGDYFIQFLGRQFRVPNPPEQLLEWYYGNWKVPTTPAEFPGYIKTRKVILIDKYLKYFSGAPNE